MIPKAFLKLALHCTTNALAEGSFPKHLYQKGRQSNSKPYDLYDTAGPRLPCFRHSCSPEANLLQKKSWNQEHTTWSIQRQRTSYIVRPRQSDVGHTWNRIGRIIAPAVNQKKNFEHPTYTFRHELIRGRDFSLSTTGQKGSSKNPASKRIIVYRLRITWVGTHSLPVLNFDKTQTEKKKTYPHLDDHAWRRTTPVLPELMRVLVNHQLQPLYQQKRMKLSTALHIAMPKQINAFLSMWLKFRPSRSLGPKLMKQTSIALLTHIESPAVEHAHCMA